MSIFLAFDSRALLADALADRVAAVLGDGIATRGRASLAVSGGSTPGLFFDALSTRDLDWEKVDVTLVDERFVPPDHPRSNHALVAARLLQNRAAKARFVPLYHPAADAEAAAHLAAAATDQLSKPFDVVILGMGNDGHTASFFPGGNHLQAAIDARQTQPVLTMEAEGAGETRLTFTLSRLSHARLLALHIEGAEKRSVLEKAADGRDEAEMPVRAMLRRAGTEIEIYWAP